MGCVGSDRIPIGNCQTVDVYESEIALNSEIRDATDLKRGFLVSTVRSRNPSENCAQLIMFSMELMSIRCLLCRGSRRRMILFGIHCYSEEQPIVMMQK